MSFALPLAHLAHWYSPLGFLVPALLTLVWLKLQGRRERREARAGRARGSAGSAVVAEYWTLEERAGRWVLVAVEPDAQRAQELAMPVAPSPWSEAGGA
jgi:hypothetical protein